MAVAGFESIGMTGSYQVDSSFPTLCLERKGTLVSAQYTNGETTNTSPTRVQLTLNDGEILALSCASFCAMGSKVGSLVSVYVDSPAGAQVDYYIFKPGHVQSATFGLQLFDGNGTITFDTDWKLFDVRLILDDYVSSTLDSSRKYAFVHCKIGTKIQYRKVVNGMPPNYVSFYIRTTSFSAYRISGPVIECALRVVDNAATRPSASGSGQSSDRTWSNDVMPSALIIDVTGF